jgi:hypothetical protein
MPGTLFLNQTAAKGVANLAAKFKSGAELYFSFERAPFLTGACFSQTWFLPPAPKILCVLCASAVKPSFECSLVFSTINKQHTTQTANKRIGLSRSVSVRLAIDVNRDWSRIGHGIRIEQDLRRDRVALFKRLGLYVLRTAVQRDCFNNTVAGEVSVILFKGKNAGRLPDIPAVNLDPDFPAHSRNPYRSLGLIRPTGEKANAGRRNE